MRSEGKTFSEIALFFGVTKQRIQALYKSSKQGGKITEAATKAMEKVRVNHLAVRKMWKTGKFVYECHRHHIFKSREMWTEARCPECKSEKLEFYI